MGGEEKKKVSHSPNGILNKYVSKTHVAHTLYIEVVCFDGKRTEVEVK